MQSPRRGTGAAELALASEAATPGASVAAQGGGASVFDTPGPPSPGQTSPTRYRSQEDDQGRSPEAAGMERSASRVRRTSGLGAALPAGDAAEPLAKPRLRVQGTDIILEDAASPRAADAAMRIKEQMPAGAAAGPSLQPAGNNHAPQQQQQPPQQHHHLVAAARASQSHEHELQLRLTSRTATGASNMAVASSRQPTMQLPGAAPHGDDRLRHDGGDGAGPSSSTAVEGPVRMKYRSTLTEENVTYLNKLDQYSSRPDSSERIWRWLEGSGPPFDNPPPSLGVPTVSKSNLSAAGKQQNGKRSFFSCFNCFSGR